MRYRTGGKRSAGSEARSIPPGSPYDAQGEVIMEAYMDLLQPLKQLANDGLAKFYANLAYSWLVYWDLEEKMALKERAEGYVMGDRYESLRADDTEEPELGNWDNMFYRGFFA
ncbi:uncharacterized protein B0T15DRAFT_489684 [Chaetomium strumarium]|uniref:Uncharacterized protein n=1 Tax=Chaetomium strumarium TaxID=1170767 RepID=A0AAJ0H3H6_9PEZI|nr:hypothetical protein B0T15DRAFT_489684 [Chaetomium strumarium]